MERLTLGLSDKIRAKLAVTRVVGEGMWSVVYDELAKEIRRDGLWLIAKMESKGYGFARESIYIKLRVQSLVDEVNIENTVIAVIQSENAKAAHREMLIEQAENLKEQAENFHKPELDAVERLESKGFTITKYAVGTTSNNRDWQNGSLVYKARTLDDLSFYADQQVKKWFFWTR